jgi:pimeloyl-ACP methyl ester carboxylesterase
MAASRYGTGDIAFDIDDVRAALNYELVDYAVPSYGGVDASAYATRFGSHLRSVALDSPEGTPSLQPFSIEQRITRAIPRMMRLLCARSPTCSADQSNPDATLNNLIATIRQQPVEGDAQDANGQLRHVRVDETTLLWLMFEPNGFFVDIGELLAASNALERGDTLPLLRIAAEEFIPLVSDYGDPTLQSSGAQFATQCADAQEPWDWNAPIFAREVQFFRAVAELPVDSFAPFSKEAATNLQFSTERQCIWWQRPTPFAPVVPPRATYPSTPTLVLAGDLDTTVTLEEARQVAGLFPNSTFVSVAEAGHGSVTFSQCAAALASEFIETLKVGDTTCTQSPETVWPALGRFPLFARDARPADADPNGRNQVGVTERKVVTIAVTTAVDALKRSSIGGGDGVGLRGGTFHTDFSDTGWTTTLSGCAFAQDVSVSGTIVWGADQSLSADLTVSGTGTSGGNLHVQGTWQAPGPVGQFRISGKLGGQSVAVFVPEA